MGQIIDKNSDIEISDFSRLAAEPVVSVLMLTYKHAHYLANAIDSVLAQRTDFPIELLVADDASPDGAGEIAKHYQQQRPEIVRIITGPVNIGPRANRHRASRHIRGEFLAFCEGDDYWTDPHKLQKQVDWLRAKPQVGAVHTDFDHIIFRGGKWRRLRNFQNHRYRGECIPAGNIFETLLHGSFVQTCTLCLRTELDRRFLAGFLEDSFPVGDWPLALYVASTHEIGYLPQSTAVYRRVGGSMMNSGRAVSVRMTAAYIPMIERICKRLAVPTSVCADALKPLYRSQFTLAFLSGDITLFERACDWLNVNDPTFLSPWFRRMKIRIVHFSALRQLFALKYDAKVAIDEWRLYRTEPPHMRGES